MSDLLTRYASLNSPDHAVAAGVRTIGWVAVHTNVGGRNPISVFPNNPFPNAGRS